MSRFAGKTLENLMPYTPGEQPRDMQYIKLNTNESPFPPSGKAQAAAASVAARLQLYPDPTCRALHEAYAASVGVPADCVLATNGSDEILNFAFMAFCDENTPAAFADITYGFYEVFAQLNRVPYRKIPLNEDFTLPIEAFCKNDATLFIANPNAPTGIALPASEIERILQANPDRVVLVDEAYVDFGGESCIPLVAQYDNLLVTQTFSKSRSMAGARLGFGVGNPALIADLNIIKYSTNPYNINSMTMAAGLGVLADESYTRANCETVIENREYLAAELARMGFIVLPSRTNFVFAKHPRMDGEEIYRYLRERGILVRHFTSPRIADYNRITIGARADMETLVNTLQKILEETT
ncbi:MAG: histidinol-phosphate transaminase [Clostridia bacterium]|nr:histidinol-phosphate transaminase [Clostridia bacterium]